MEGRNNIEKLNSINSQVPLDDGDDLFSPSDKVWENVSKHLPIKKKRRPIIPIFILALGLSMGVIYMWNESENSKKDMTDNDHARVTLVSNLEKHSDLMHQSTNDKVVQDTPLEGNAVASESKMVKQEVNQDTYEKRSIKKNSEKKTEKILSKRSSHITNTQKPDIRKLHDTDNSAVPMNSSDVRLSNQENSVIKQTASTSDAEPNQQVYSFTISDSLAAQADVTYTTREILEILPLAPIKTTLAKEEKPILEELKLIQPKVIKSYEWIYGIAGTLSLTIYNSPKVTDPLEGTIKQSAYHSVAQLNFVLNRSLSKHFFISFDPGLRYDRLSTAYDLNIPYDYNTEVSSTDKKENHFSHSLPTDLGNIKTRMVVVRASDSPVVHNEKINISFDVNYKTISVTSPIGIHYALKNKFEGLYMGVRFVPQYVISRIADVTKFESHHTYVKSDHVDISKVANYNNLYMGGDIQVGYRLPLKANRISLDINATYHKNLMSEGRPQDLGFGIALLKSF